MENILLAHNKQRRLHRDTPDLVWDLKLAEEAQYWALELAKSGAFKHSSTTSGENLYYQWSSKLIDERSACEKAVESWYSEIQNYNLSTHKSTGVTGHFTQLVWKSSQRVGVGVASASVNGGHAVFVVGRYFPAGNVVSKHEENVKPLK